MESISQLVSDSLARNGIETGIDHLRLEWSRWFHCESSFSVLLAPAKPGIFALGEEMVPPAITVVDGQSRGDRNQSTQIDNPELRTAPSAEGKRMLALLQISETDDLGIALGRLFLPGNKLRERLGSGRCFARYTVIEDAAQRSAAYAVFQRWMQNAAESASGIQQGGADTLARDAEARNPVLTSEPDPWIDRLTKTDAAVAGNRQLPSDDPLPSSVLIFASKAAAASSAGAMRDSSPSISSALGVEAVEVEMREPCDLSRSPMRLPSGF
jgi:hypothetical protein